MDIIKFIIDFILHIDVHLAELVAQYGMWVYAILFLILFCETGLVVTPFLPGDSLLFVAGALLFNFPLLRLWLGEGLWFGLPRLPLALFVAWAVLIALLAWWMERADTGAADASDPGVEP